ncbi:TetR family transcriptional regulator [Nocardioides sp.]|uniref:TetR/AcrR family transcriptional regulator n=1 Tax=Nocardioides sp. TaxID=35761 RepID=UPI00351424AF
MSTPAPTTRARLVEAAGRLTAEHGWAQVTMARLADEVGVSRQTVYNEVSGRAGLAEAMIERELERFLEVVTGAFDAHPPPGPAALVAAISDACLGCLHLATDNALLHAIVSATHGADTELLPLLTTHAGSLLEAAKAVVVERVRPYEHGLADDRLSPVVDMVVRVVLSHVMQPSADPGSTAADLAWLAARVLGTAPPA